MKKREMFTFVCFICILTLFGAPSLASDNSCLDCHEKLTAFNEKEKQLNEVRIKHLERDVACSLECHATTLDKFAKSNYEQWTRSKHALFQVTCNNCHGGDPSSDVKESAHIGVLRSSDPNGSVFYRNVPETCGKCHTEEYNQFKESLHYQRLKDLKQAPTCDTCHSPHEFKVLNSTDFKDLCSSCHNIELEIAPDIPEKASKAIENAQALKSEIFKARSAIQRAKQQGKDITAAQKHLDAAISIQDNLPIQWHSFNLPHFQNVTDEGINYARTSQEDSGFPPEKPKTPGFGIISSLIGMSSIYLLVRRK
ncbi:MAG: cytochrome c3 family protein [Candidatus Methanoperedens sp.]|nr:cytochrome c3 family protein [Candidatus Methanoperedens sp.]